MDRQKKKELVSAWKERHPEMGVMALVCTATGDTFLTAAKDTKVGLNRHTFQLSAGMHPNKALQALWDQHGEAGFERAVVQVLDYEDPAEDYLDELADLLELYLLEHPEAKKL